MTAIVIWIVIAVVLAVIEMCTVGLLAIWFAIGAAITAIVLGIYPEASLAVQIIIFGATSFLLFLLTRNKIKKFQEKSGSQPVYSILGKTALVTKEIDSVKGTGQISINGDIWSAKSINSNPTIPVNTKVEVLEIDGVKAVVKVIEDTNNEKNN